MGYLKATGTVFIYVALFLAAITFIPGLPPDAEFKEYSIVTPRDLDPRLGPKNRLSGAERLFEGQLVGPEAFADYNGQLYTSIHGGYVVRIEESHFVPIAKFGKKCDGLWEEHICGRPLGLRFDKKGNLYVMDTYYGMFKVNVATGDYVNVVNISEPISGERPLLPNSVDITENGDIYWTDSTSKLRLCDLIPLFFINPSGRLMRYDAATKKNEVLMKNLAFANGIKLSDDESFLIVAETLSCRIMKYHLKGPKAGQQEIFLEGLPGMPDNIQTDGRGGFLISLIISTDSEHPELTILLPPHPYIRKMIVRLMLILQAPFKLLNELIPNIYAAKLAHAATSYQGIGVLFDTASPTVILRVDASGNILEAISSSDGTITGISEAHIHNGYLWLGSPWRDYISRVPLKQAFPDLASDESLSSGAKKSAGSHVDPERTKRDTDAAATKSKDASPQKPKATAAPTTTPKPTAAPTTTPKPTAAPTEAPKATAAPKASKPTGNAKPSDGKPASRSANADAKDKTSSKTKEDSKKPNTGKSGKNVEQDTPVKQKAAKAESEKVKAAETTNRPEDSKKK